MKSLIYGYGETGKSFERYLNKNNEDFEIFDSNINKYNNNLNLKNFDKIFCSPGIPRATFEKLVKVNKNVLTDVCLLYTSPSPRD